MILVAVLGIVGVVQISLGMEYCGHLLRWHDSFYYWGDIIALFFGGTVSLAQAVMRLIDLVNAKRLY